MIYQRITKLGGTQYYYQAKNSNSYTQMSRCGTTIANISHGHKLPSDVSITDVIFLSLKQTCKFLDSLSLSRFR